MIIDAHQHFWKLDRGDYDWLTPELGALYRDFLPDDLAPLRAAAGITGSVLVQAAPTVAETRFLLELSEIDASVLGVVGWLDLTAADAPDAIAELAAHPRFVGVRPMLQDLPDDEWMLRADLRPALDALMQHGLTFDALVLPRHLAVLREFLDRYPALPVVIDHAAKPAIRAGNLNHWRHELRGIAAAHPVRCKLSGLINEAGPSWRPQELQPIVNVVLDAFGTERVLWGSDWPVVNVHADYATWWSVANELLSGLDEASRRAVLGGNAAAFYEVSC